MSKSVFDTLLESERLILRRLSTDDTEDMYEYTSNHLVTTHLSWEPHTDINQTREFINRVCEKYDLQNTEFTYGIELKTNRKLIGALKILNISYYNKRAEFTSILNPIYQGKGYMGEAWQMLLKYCFEEAGLNRIQSYVTPENFASIKKNLKAGLVLEGRLKDWWLMKGVFQDALVYAITAEMYQKLHKE